MAYNDSKNPYSDLNKKDATSEMKSTNDELTVIQDKIEDEVDKLLQDKEGSSNKMSEEEMKEAMDKVFEMIMEQVQQLDNEQDITQILNNLLKKKFVRLPPALMKKAISSVKVQVVGKFAQKVSDGKQAPQTGQTR
jgi:hypothetical protein